MHVSFFILLDFTEHPLKMAMGIVDFDHVRRFYGQTGEI